MFVSAGFHLVVRALLYLFPVVLIRSFEVKGLCLYVHCPCKTLSASLLVLDPQQVQFWTFTTFQKLHHPEEDLLLSHDPVSVSDSVVNGPLVPVFNQPETGAGLVLESEVFEADIPCCC